MGAMRWAFTAGTVKNERSTALSLWKQKNARVFAMRTAVRLVAPIGGEFEGEIITRCTNFSTGLRGELRETAGESADLCTTDKKFAKIGPQNT